MLSIKPVKKHKGEPKVKNKANNKYCQFKLFLKVQTCMFQIKRSTILLSFKIFVFTFS